MITILTYFWILRIIKFFKLLSLLRKVAHEAEKLLDIPETIYTNETTYSKNPQDILGHRKRLAESILKLKE